ncbi:TPA: hypothetical protein ACFP4Y_001454 [Neisseria bacilliformis]
MKRLLPTLLYTAALLLTAYAAWCSSRALALADFKTMTGNHAAAEIWLYRRMYAILAAWASGIAASALLPRRPFEKAAAAIVFFCIYGVIAAFV